MTRVAVIVLDGVGAGALPDAAAYGDEGSNTLRHVIETTGVALPNLSALGLGEIVGPLGGPSGTTEDEDVDAGGAAPLARGAAAPGAAPAGDGSMVSAPWSSVTAPRPGATYGRLLERGAGKDTTAGHWELMGLVVERPFPTYPEGFPADVIEPFERVVGRHVLANRPASGTAIIEELGDEHVASGRPIVYTSADSVFQIACH
ncbi:MAG: hypothetical protein JW767_00620, partial [Thermoleophilia bacterium]|nr:hypothetical protein [Thermoleophilia bacterium]